MLLMWLVAVAEGAKVVAAAAFPLRRLEAQHVAHVAQSPDHLPPGVPVLHAEQPVQPHALPCCHGCEVSFFLWTSVVPPLCLFPQWQAAFGLATHRYPFYQLG